MTKLCLVYNHEAQDKKTPWEVYNDLASAISYDTTSGLRMDATTARRLMGVGNTHATAKLQAVMGQCYGFIRVDPQAWENLKAECGL